MEVGLRRVAERGVGLRQRIVHGGSRRVARQHGLEMIDGRARVVRREGYAAQTEPRRDRRGLQRQRRVEAGLRGIRLPELQERLAEPHERGDVRRVAGERALEGRTGRLGLAALAVELRQVVRPAVVGGRQRLGAREKGGRGVRKLRRHQQQPDVARRLTLLHIGSARRRQCRDPGEAIAHLCLHRRRELREIRQRRHLECAAAPRRITTRGAKHDREHQHW
jgi:hypothetical protein